VWRQAGKFEGGFVVSTWLLAITRFKALSALRAEKAPSWTIEKSVEEVAEIVGIPENTVKTRLFHPRKKLAELLKAAGIERGWP
jgi:RNA polymerase sigma-70 factor, ECF subfamily